MANGVYECKWYDIPPRDAKNLLFMIYRSTIPLKLTAGKFGTFSLEMFGTVSYLEEKYIISQQKIPFFIHRKSDKIRL